MRKATIGVAITTRNRPADFKKTYESWKKFLPPGTVLVVVDDASDKLVPEANYRFEFNAGIAAAKNKALEILMGAGVEHLFLSDDDCYPIVDNWHLPYINSGIKHLCFTFPRLANGRANGRKFITTRGVISEYESPCGCMLYAHRSVVETVGGFDVNYPTWGFEHVDWSNRIHNAGLTPYKFLDYAHSLKLFRSLDHHSETSSSVNASTRALIIPENRERYRLNKNSRKYMEYKLKQDGVILAAYFNGTPDGQRGTTWDSSGKALDPLRASCRDLGLKICIFHDCLNIKGESENETFIKVSPTKEYSPNVYRWLVYKKWLEKNPQENVFMVDSTDVEVLRHPFLSINPDSLYVGSEFNMIVDNLWMRKNQEPLLDIQDYRLTIVKYAREVLPNCGIVGGDYQIVMEYLKYRELYHAQYTKGQLKSTDMAIFNYLLWKHFPDRMVSGIKISTRFKMNEYNPISFFKHK